MGVVIHAIEGDIRRGNSIGIIYLADLYHKELT